MVDASELPLFAGETSVPQAHETRKGSNDVAIAPSIQEAPKKRPVNRGGRASRATPSIRQRLRDATTRDLTNISESDYVQVGALQYALPYRHIFTMHYRARWHHMKLIDVFLAEFNHVDIIYWNIEFNAGRVQANGIRAHADTRWEADMYVEHVVHRHESAIARGDPILLHDGAGLVAVAKPPSLPVHPCGTYRRNCLQFRVAATLGLRHLHVLHRLDKETSGVVIFARTRDAAAVFGLHMRAGTLTKQYIAEVTGQFTQDGAVELPLSWDSALKRASVDDKIGKPSCTIFRALQYRTTSTLIEALPQTGRSHQIRAHIAATGHPILGDTVYGGPALPDVEGANAVLADAGEPGLRALSEGEALRCTTCPRLGNVRGTDAQARAAVIRLHAARYACENEWAFEAPLPEWARE